MSFRIRNSRHTVRRKVSKPRSANHKKRKTDSRKHSANNVTRKGDLWDVNGITGKSRKNRGNPLGSIFTKDHAENLRLDFVRFLQTFRYEKQRYYSDVYYTLGQVCQMCIDTPGVCKGMDFEDIDNLKTTRGIKDEHGNLIIDSVFHALDRSRDPSEFIEQSKLIKDNFNLQRTANDLTMENIIEMVKTVPIIDLTEDDFMACIPSDFEDLDEDYRYIEVIEIPPEQSTIARSMAHSVYNHYMGLKRAVRTQMMTGRELRTIKGIQHKSLGPRVFRTIDSFISL